MPAFDIQTATADPSARAIADAAPIGIFRANAAGEILYINPSLERISGVRAERALGRSWLRSIPADWRDEVERRWQAAIDAGENAETELRFKHPDGSLRYASIRMAAERKADGVINGVVGFVSDITEQRVAQSRLRRNERLFRMLAENATDIIVRLDLNDHVTYASPAMEEITGFPTEGTIGMNPISYMHPDDAAHAKECSRQLKDGEIEQAIVEYRTPHLDGHYIWLEARSRLVRDSSGKPREVISVVRDISEQKRLQDQIVAAREAEKQASDAQSRFLATMSHEIRTPIGGVIGMIDLLLDSDDVSQRQRYKAALASSARTLLRVVDDVLDYSRFSAVGIVLENEPFDIFASIHSVIDLYRPAAEAKGVVLSLQFEAANRYVLGDATRLNQVLGNLVSNAIKFTDKGRIDIEAVQVARRWRFSVSDTGIGISSEDQAKLFEAFAQANNKDAGAFGGTGLGLAIAKIIVAAMGGSIQVTSNIGEGSRFHFDVELPPTKVLPADDVEKGCKQSAAKPLRLLIAEDNDVNLLYLTRVLENMGHSVTGVSDGLKAVDAAREQRFDAILMDRHMPRLDGESAARLIRDLGRGPAPLLILISAARDDLHGGTPVRSELFDASVPKPIRPDELAKILTALEGSADPAESHQSPNDLHDLLGIEAASELERMFRANLAERLMALGSAIAVKDGDLIRREAHAIAGAAHLIGQGDIGDAASRADSAADKTVLAAARNLHALCRAYLSINSAI